MSIPDPYKTSIMDGITACCGAEKLLKRLKLVGNYVEYYLDSLEEDSPEHDFCSDLAIMLEDVRVQALAVSKNLQSFTKFMR